MPFQPISERLRKIAETETRTFLVPEETALDLPPGIYAFLEAFCNEPKCDCRRVMFHVINIENHHLEAVIAYGWGSTRHYLDWFPSATQDDLDELQGPNLNYLMKQGPHAKELLKIFEEVFLTDQKYMDRVKKHYRLFRGTVDKRMKGENPLRWSRRRTGG